METPARACAGAALEYSIQGDNLQVARIQLKPGQEIYARPARCLQNRKRALGDAHERRYYRR